MAACAVRAAADWAADLPADCCAAFYININNSVWLFVAISVRPCQGDAASSRGCQAKVLCCLQVLYAMASCLIGEIARLPLIAGAADQRVP